MSKKKKQNPPPPARQIKNIPVNKDLIYACIMVAIMLAGVIFIISLNQ